MITKLTAMIITTRDDVQVTASGPMENGKYAGLVTLGHESRYRLLLSTDAIYDSAELAKESMQAVIQQVREKETMP